jgi:iron complex transport system substrate-binding protein
MLKARSLAGGLALIAMGLAQAVTVRDDRQQEVSFSQAPARIVSLLPSLTETVCALGQCRKLVGLDRYSNWPASVRQLPRLGGGLDPNIELVVAQRPDLVLMATSARGAERLQSLGITVLALEPRTHADLQHVINTLAKVLGVPASHSERLWREINAGVLAAAQSLPSQARGQKVYVEVSPAPYGASESSFIGETLMMMGLRNILPGNMGPFPKINPEFVVRAQPDIIMAGDSSRASMLQRPGWSQLKVIQSDQVCVFNTDESDVLVRAGPRMAEGARLMAQCIARSQGSKP